MIYPVLGHMTARDEPRFMDFDPRSGREAQGEEQGDSSYEQEVDWGKTDNG